MRVRLIAVAGTGKREETEYHLEGEGAGVRTRLSIEAVIRLHRLDRPHVHVLATREARKEFEHAQEPVAAVAQELEIVEIPAGRDRREQDLIFTRVGERIHEGDRIHLDITHAFRHLPFLVAAATTFACAAAGARLAGIHYGAFVPSDPQRTPLLDVTAWATHIGWYHALQTAVETTSWQQMCRLLQSERGWILRERPGAAPVLKAIDDLAGPIACALPLEAGMGAGALLKAIDQDAGGSGAFSGLERSIRRVVEPWALRETRKGDVALTPKELERQLRFTEFLVERHETAQAFLVLREWYVDHHILERFRRPRDWLDDATRVQAEDAMWRKARDGHTELQAWRGLRDRRNALAHVGMTSDPAGASDGYVRDRIRECRALLQRASSS